VEKIAYHNGKEYFPTKPCRLGVVAGKRTKVDVGYVGYPAGSKTVDSEISVRRRLHFREVVNIVVSNLEPVSGIVQVRQLFVSLDN
jgi:hypothetical protein